MPTKENFFCKHTATMPTVLTLQQTACRNSTHQARIATKTIASLHFAATVYQQPTATLPQLPCHTNRRITTQDCCDKQSPWHKTQINCVFATSYFCHTDTTPHVQHKPSCRNGTATAARQQKRAQNLWGIRSAVLRPVMGAVCSCDG